MALIQTTQEVLPELAGIYAASPPPGVLTAELVRLLVTILAEVNSDVDSVKGTLTPVAAVPLFETRIVPIYSALVITDARVVSGASKRARNNADTNPINLNFLRTIDTTYVPQ